MTALDTQELNCHGLCNITMLATQPDLWYHNNSTQLNTHQQYTRNDFSSLATSLGYFNNTCPESKGGKVSLIFVGKGMPRSCPEHTQVLEAQVSATWGYRQVSGGPALGGALFFLACLEEFTFLLCSTAGFPLAVFSPQIPSVSPSLVLSFHVILAASSLTVTAVALATL